MGWITRGRCRFYVRSVRRGRRSSAAEMGDVSPTIDEEPVRGKTLTVMDFLDQATWKPIPDALFSSNILGWSSTIIVFDNLKQADAKGVIVVLLDTRGVTTPADLDG